MNLIPKRLRIIIESRKLKRKGPFGASIIFYMRKLERENITLRSKVQHLEDVVRKLREL
jgi:hypothetical protein